MYYGERKTGCRFMEVIFHGCKTLIIENNVMRTMLIVDKGTNIVSYILKSHDQEFIWTNPMGLSCIKKFQMSNMDNESYSDNYIGGCFEIIPNVGRACNVDNNYFCNNSETAYLPWSYQVEEDTEQRMVFCFTVKLSKYPIFIKKRLTIHMDSPALQFEEEIQNIGNTEIPYQWGLHPCIGFPFLDQDCVIETPFNSDVKMPAEGTGIESLVTYLCDGNGFAAIRNTKSGIGFGLSWETSAFPFCALWVCSGYKQGHHRKGGSYVASILPKNTECFDLDVAVKNNECRILKGGEQQSCWYTLTSFVSEEHTGQIDRNGKVQNAIL